MADILLQKPAAGQTTTLTPQAEDRLVFEFDSADATLTRDGDNLVMSFDDGSAVNLTDFYVAYTSENMPTFLIEGAEVDGEAFFAALGEELMPAAGPATGAPQGSGSSVDTLAGTLLGGIDRLGRLDQEYPASSFDEENPEGAGINNAPSLLGFIEIPDGNDDKHLHLSDADMFVTESGVGRDDTGVVNSVNPNKVYGGDLSVAVQVVASDPEGDTLTFSVRGSSPYGTVSIDRDTGVLTFTLNDGAANSLNQDEVIEENFIVTVTDSQGNSTSASIKLAIVGSNDKPTISFEGEDVNDDGVVSGFLGVKEDDILTDDGKATSKDDDRDGAIGDEGTYFVSTATQHGNLGGNTNDPNDDLRLETENLGSTVKGDMGTFSVGADGSFTYKLDNTNPEVQSLGEGEYAKETFYVYVQDSEGAWSAKPVEVTIEGKNDQPTISITSKDQNVKEEGVGDNFTVTIPFVGDITIDKPNAENPDADATAQGSITLSDVDSSDTVSTLTLVFNNSNGTKLEVEAGDYYVLPDGSLVTSVGDDIDYVGKLTFTGTNTGFDYIFSLNNESITVNGYDEGEEHDFGLSFSVKDDSNAYSESTVDLSFTIEGTNERPVITKADNIVISEDDAFETEDAQSTDADDEDISDTESATPNLEYLVLPGHVSGLPKFEDIEELPLLALPVAPGEYGSLSIDATTGKYTYKFYDSGKEQTLSEGEDHIEYFTIFVKDEQGAWNYKEITVTVNGKNDGPTDFEVTVTDNTVIESGVGRDAAGNIIKNGTAGQENTAYTPDNLTASGLLSVKDVDASDDVAFSVAKNADGKEIITVTDVNGDVIPGVDAADFGSFVITDTGDDTASYMFTLKDANNDVVNSLNEGEKVTITYTVEANDGNGGIIHKDVTITIEGTNDQPIISSEMTSTDHNVTEDNKDDVAKGFIRVDDADDDGDELSEQTLSVTFDSETESASTAGGNVEISGTYGTLTINGTTGAYEYSLQNEMPDVTDYTGDTDPEYLAAVARYEAVQALGENDTKPESFTVTTTDKHGANSETSLEFNVKGTNDNPILSMAGSEITSYDVLANEDAPATTDKNEDIPDSGVKYPDGSYPSGIIAGSFTFKDVDTAITDLIITIKGIEFTVTEEANGDLSLVAKNGETQVDGSFGNLSNFEISGPDANGYYKVDYDYNQTKTSTNHSKDTNEQTATGGNLHENAESFEVKVGDGIGTEQTGSITVDIVDDVIVLNDTDTSTTVGAYDANTGHYIAVTDPDNSVGHAKVGGTVEFAGADGLASMEIVPPSISATVPFYQQIIVDGAKVQITIALGPDGKLYGVSGEKDNGSLIFDDPYFTFEVDNNGEWVFVQTKPFAGDITVEVKGTDADGDSDTYEIKITADSKPSVGNSATAQVSEAFLGDGSQEDPGKHENGEDFPNSAAFAGEIENFYPGNLTEDHDFDAAFAWNVEGDKVFSDAANTNEITLETSAGETVLWKENGTTLEGYVVRDDKDVPVITVTMSKDGKFEIILSESVEHANADGNNTTLENGKTDLNFGFTITDVDGDVAAGNVSAQIEDDVPDVVENQEAVLAADGSSQAIVEIDFGADNGDGKQLEFGGSTFTFNGTNWETDTTLGGLVDGNTLTAADGSTLTNNGTSDLWTATFSKDNVDSKDSTIKVTDADGDNVNITFESKEVDGDVLAVSAEPGSLEQGTDYNIAVALDTSGTMYGDGGYSGYFENDNGELTTRLDASCDALIALAESLTNHIGTVNFSIIPFWGTSDNDRWALDFKDVSSENIDEIIGKINDLRLDLKYGSAVTLSPDAVLGEGTHTVVNTYSVYDVQSDGTFKKATIEEIFVYDGDKLLYVECDGIKYAVTAKGEIKYDYSGKDTPSESNTGNANENLEHWHWGTDYEEGLKQVDSWLTEQGNDYENKLYFLSDGKPTEGVKTEEGLEKLADALEKEHDVTIDTIGIGKGAAESFLGAMDSDGKAFIVNDADAKEMFDIQNGIIASQSASVGLGKTSDGDDVVVTGVSIDVLKKMLTDQLGSEPSMDLILNFLKNNPEWVAQNIDAAKDDTMKYTISGGAGDDHIYSQEANDLLIGDGDGNSLKDLATELQLADADKYEWNTLADSLVKKDTNGDGVIDDADDKPEGDTLVENLIAAAKNDVAALESAATKMEDSANDGDDTIYGNDGDDILLGLGGNDTLVGGVGADIMIGGSGDDVFIGDLNDTIIGGTGKDLIILPELENVKIDDVLSVDGGAEMDVLLAGAGSLDGVKEKLENGEITNVELLVFGSDIKGNTVNDIIDELDITDDLGNVNANWLKVNNGSVTGQDGTVYDQYKDGDITILVSKAQLESGNF